MSAARWSRLAETLQNADLAPVKVDERAYPGGVSRSITIALPEALVEIHDRWWRKNDAVWIGWSVHVEDRRSSLVTREWPLTKKRSEVTAFVRAAMLAATKSGGV